MSSRRDCGFRADAPAEIAATLSAVTVEPDVTTTEATEAQADAERIVANITLVVGKKTFPIDNKKMRPWVSFAETADGGYEPVIDTSQIPTLLDGLAAKIDVKPVNATFKTSGTGHGRHPSKDGHSSMSRHRTQTRRCRRPCHRHGLDRDPPGAHRPSRSDDAEAKAAR
jgi:vancomycin resistance protein YoaR